MAKRPAHTSRKKSNPQLPQQNIPLRPVDTLLVCLPLIGQGAHRTKSQGSDSRFANPFFFCHGSVCQPSGREKTALRHSPEPRKRAVDKPRIRPQGLWKRITRRQRRRGELSTVSTALLRLRYYSIQPPFLSSARRRCVGVSLDPTKADPRPREDCYICGICGVLAFLFGCNMV